MIILFILYVFKLFPLYGGKGVSPYDYKMISLFFHDYKSVCFLFLLDNKRILGPLIIRNKNFLLLQKDLFFSFYDDKGFCLLCHDQKMLFAL